MPCTHIMNLGSYFGILPVAVCRAVHLSFGPLAEKTRQHSTSFEREQKVFFVLQSLRDIK